MIPYDFPLLGDRELKYDGHSKKCGEFFEKNDEVLEGGANLWCGNTRGSTYRKRDFSRGCVITIAICNLIPLTHIHLLFMDDLELCSKSKKGPGFPYPDSKNI